MATINEVDSSLIFEELSKYVKVAFAVDVFRIGDFNKPDIIDYFEGPSWTRRFVRDPKRSNEHFDVYSYKLEFTYETALILYPAPIDISTLSV